MSYGISKDYLSEQQCRLLCSKDRSKASLEKIETAGVRVYLGDILVFSRTKVENAVPLELDRIFEKLHATGLKFRFEKCVFTEKSVKDLGYILSKTGIEVNPDRIQAIIEAPAPTNSSEARRLLGGLVMLSHFEPRIAEETVRLNALSKDW